jgi:hypothetical protein
MPIPKENLRASQMTRNLRVGYVLSGVISQVSCVTVK